MKRKIISLLCACTMAFVITGCAANTPSVTEAPSQSTEQETSEKPAPTKESIEEEKGADFHIGIVTGSFSQSEDDRRGAQAFQDKSGFCQLN